MGIISALVGLGAAAALGGATSKAMGNSFWKGTIGGVIGGPIGGAVSAGIEKSSNAKKEAQRLTEQSQKRSAVLSTAQQRLTMTPGGASGQELQSGDFRTKRNIFGN
jgi:hypothetical protein